MAVTQQIENEATSKELASTEIEDPVSKVPEMEDVLMFSIPCNDSGVVLENRTVSAATLKCRIDIGSDAF